MSLPLLPQLAQAKAQLTTAQQNLSFTQVKSPSDGVINNIPYRVGALVSPSIATPMTTVSEIDEVYVYFSMTEKELLAMTKSGSDQIFFSVIQVENADFRIF